MIGDSSVSDHSSRETSGRNANISLFFESTFGFVEMPNSENAKKRLRQSIEDRARNRACKSAIRTAIRKIRDLVKAGKPEDARKLMPAMCKQLDQAAAKKIIHVNKSARLKSRLTHLLRSGNKTTAA